MLLTESPASIAVCTVRRDDVRYVLLPTWQSALHKVMLQGVQSNDKTGSTFAAEATLKTTCRSASDDRPANRSSRSAPSCAHSSAGRYDRRLRSDT